MSAHCTAAQRFSRTLDNTKRVRAWFFTLNNYTDLDIKLLEARFKFMKAYAVQCEIAPSTGTPHLQGIIWWKHGKTFGAMRKLMPRAKLFIHDPKKDINAAVYCTKVHSSTGRKWTFNIDRLLKLAAVNRRKSFKFVPTPEWAERRRKMCEGMMSDHEQEIARLKNYLEVLDQHISFFETRGGRSKSD